MYRTMRPQILIAEDDEDIRQTLTTTFAVELGDDVEVVEAENGQIALECIRRNMNTRFRCVLTDFDMPGANGVKVASAALEAAVPHVVLMTARDKASLAKACGENGQKIVDDLLGKGMGYMQKPFDLDAVISEIIDPLRKKV